MKKCPRCGKSKALSLFHKNRVKKDRHQLHCKECQRIYVRGHYEKNRDYYLKKAKERNVKRRAVICEVLREAKTRPCRDCGKTYPYWVMDFDHVRGKKKFSLAHAAGSASIEVIKLEIKKCEVVCANCHRDRTHRRMVSSRGVQFLPA